MISSKLRSGYRSVQRLRQVRKLARRVREIETYVTERGRARREDARPVLFLNASTRIHHMSQNAAFQLLAAWAVRLRGVEAVQLVCDRGMLQCMLGTDKDNPGSRPPCRACLGMSRRLYPGEGVNWLQMDRSTLSLLSELQTCSLAELIGWSHAGYPLGELCLPTLQWALRRTDLEDDAPTRVLMRKYLVSAVSLVRGFEGILEKRPPQRVVAFNGVTYPEAVLRAVALRAGLPVVTHEVGMRPYSAFFSHGHATAYPIEIPKGFELDSEAEANLDRYLERRFSGRFTMAGVQFWPEMESLPPWLQASIRAHSQMVVVFTNVIFDTSQIHADTLFEDMFDWLDALAEMIREHRNTLFVIRAHPDEMRPGKESRQSVGEWFERAGLRSSPNVAFIPPTEYISSYELIRQAKFTMVYNSSIGLEASILGAPVLCAGKARYTQAPTVFFPRSRARYRKLLQRFLAESDLEAPGEHRQHARRFLYYQLYGTALDFSRYLGEDPLMRGGVELKRFEPSELEPGNSAEMEILGNGILEGRPFVYGEPG